MSGNRRWRQFKGWFKGADHLIFEKGRGRYGWFQKKIFYRLISSEKKTLQGNTCIIGKTNFITKGLRKKILTQTKSPLTPLKSQMVGAYLIQVSSSARQHQTGRQSSTGESVFKKALCHLEETPTDYIKTVATSGIYVIYEDTSVADSWAAKTWSWDTKDPGGEWSKARFHRVTLSPQECSRGWGRGTVNIKE